MSEICGEVDYMQGMDGKELIFAVTAAELIALLV